MPSLEVLASHRVTSTLMISAETYLVTQTSDCRFRSLCVEMSSYLDSRVMFIKMSQVVALGCPVLSSAAISCFELLCCKKGPHRPRSECVYSVCSFESSPLSSTPLFSHSSMYLPNVPFLFDNIMLAQPMSDACPCMPCRLIWSLQLILAQSKGKPVSLSFSCPHPHFYYVGLHALILNMIMFLWRM